MKKRGGFMLLLVLFIIIMSSFCYGFASLTPSTFYEGTNQLLYININNYQQNYTITNIDVDTPGEVTEVLDILGWDFDNNETHIHWYSGTIETNVINAVFAFRLDTPMVTADETQTIKVTKTELPGFKKSQELEINLLNDDTPPDITSITPADGGFIQAGKSSQDITVLVEEQETNILSVTYSYGDCNNTETETLVCDEGTCTGVADFTDFTEGDTACFSVTATNTGYESNTVSGQLGFDNTPPTVHAISPINGDAVGTEAEFTLYASDNMPGTITCEISIDSEIVAEVVAENAENTIVLINTENQTEGNHTWTVECEDEVGLVAEDSESFTIDNTPPEITSTPASGSNIFKSTEIEIEVVDNAAVAEIIYDKELNVSSWDYGENELKVTATDTVGNTAEETFTYNVLDEYVFDFELSPSTVSPGSNVDVIGTITKEDGTSIPETTVVFEYASENITIVDDAFSYSFNAPDDEGIYEISIAIYAENGYTYNIIKELEVATPSSPPRGRSGNPAKKFYSSTGIEPQEVPRVEFTLPPPPTDSSGGQNLIEQEEYGLDESEPGNEITGAVVGGGNKLLNAKWWIVAALVLVGLGFLFYASRGRPKTETFERSKSMDWTGYFDRKN